MKEYTHIVNVFSKTKKTKFEFTDRVPTAAFDMVNDEFLINQSFFQDVVKKVNKEYLYGNDANVISFYFLLGHELGHQWWTVHDMDRMKQPIDFYRFVQNVVEDTYIEPAWENLMSQYDINQMQYAMRIGRKVMVSDDYCKELELKELTIHTRLHMLIAYAYNKTYIWSVDFLPKELLDFFQQIIYITDDNLRLDKEIEFADMLLQYLDDTNQPQPNDPSSGEGEPSTEEIIKDVLDKISPHFKPNSDFSEQKTVEGTIISLKELEKIGIDKINYYFKSSNTPESDLYKTLLINFNGTFNKYKFRTFNGASFNERKGDLDIHNIPFSNVRTDFFKKQNNLKREFDLEFVLLFDYSGSMAYVKNTVSDIGASFSVACIQNKIPITSLVFTDQSTLLFNNTQRNKDYVRNVFGNSREEITGGTDMLYGLKYAVNLLSRSLKKDKVIVILTDGDTDNENYIKKIIDNFKGVIIPISIDQNNPLQFNRIFSNYDKFYYTTSEVPSKLPHELITYLYKKFMKGGTQQ